MLDLGFIMKKKHEVKLPSGNVICCTLPTEGDYINIVNKRQEFEKYVLQENSSIEGTTELMNESLMLMFKGANEKDMNELLSLNVRVKTIVSNSYFEFVSNVDKSPN